MQIFRKDEVYGTDLNQPLLGLDCLNWAPPGFNPLGCSAQGFTLGLESHSRQGTALAVVPIDWVPALDKGNSWLGPLLWLGTPFLSLSPCQGCVTTTEVR